MDTEGSAKVYKGLHSDVDTEFVLRVCCVNSKERAKVTRARIPLDAQIG